MRETPLSNANQWARQDAAGVALAPELESAFVFVLQSGITFTCAQRVFCLVCALRKGFGYMILIHFIMFLSSRASRFTVRAFRKWLRRCFARRCEHFRREKRSIIAQERSEIKTKVEKKLKPKGGKSKCGGKEACRNGKQDLFDGVGGRFARTTHFHVFFPFFSRCRFARFPNRKKKKFHV